MSILEGPWGECKPKVTFTKVYLRFKHQKGITSEITKKNFLVLYTNYTILTDSTLSNSFVNHKRLPGLLRLLIFHEMSLLEVRVQTWMVFT